ncbi:hypothetical protein Tco_0824228 [Tanacetum coccineum]|uniref:Uncharacterized protein n=1 Tax=Tanacetum coccineum TaxID=301880 RepID=A0ABQ5APT5_9ASTR
MKKTTNEINAGVDHGPEKGTTTFTTFNFKYAIRIPVLNPVIVSVLPAKTCTLSKIRVTRADHSVCQCSVDANSGVIAGVSDDLFGVNTSDGDCDVDYLGQSSKGYLNLKYENPATLCSLLLLQTCSIIKPLYPVGSNPISQGPSQMYLRC